MATQTTEQQNALKDAMERAKQIAAKLQQQAGGGGGGVGGGGVVGGGGIGIGVGSIGGGGTEPSLNKSEESRKRSFRESLQMMNSEPAKRPAMEGIGVDHTDPKVIAQQVANSLVQRAGLGSMLVEEIMIPNKIVGLVIGRGGEMINKLQSESGAKIQVAPDPSPELAHMYTERQVTITGVSDAVEKAKGLIDEIKLDGKVPERLLIGGINSGEYSMEMKIATGKVGLVIGKGGETIKSLQERAGCKMVLFQDGEYASDPEKPLRISGEQSKVLYGKQLVEDLLVSKELESLHPDKIEQHGDGGAYGEFEVPREAVGFVIGSKGQSINQIQQQTGCRIQFKNDMAGEFKIATLNGTPQQVAFARQKLNEILQSHSERRRGGGRDGNWQGGSSNGPRSWGPPQGGPGGPGGPRGPGGWGPGPQGTGGPRGWAPQGHGPRGPGPFSGPPTLPPGHKHVIIRVPANRCGLVIGKGGETLKYIHNETKVQIDINREVPNSAPYRMFHVRGSDEMIEECLTIIRDKIGDQTISAKPAEEGGSGPSQSHSWGPNQGPNWGGPPQNQQWGNGHPSGWGQLPQDQWNQQTGAWNQPLAGNWSQPPQQGAWNQQSGTWNQQQPQQQGWDQSQQQWGQQSQQTYNPWAQQQPAQTAQAQTYPGQPPAPTDPASAAQTPQTTDPAQSGQQQDYSAAWALYYQQQQQYYQQYMQPNASQAVTAAAPATDSTSQAPTTPTTPSTQSQAVTDYQAKLAEYYKSFGQQPPSQQ